MPTARPRFVQSVAYFVARLLGYNNVQNYDGAWAEWGNRQGHNDQYRL